MLTKNQFYITSQIEEQVRQDPESHMMNMSFNEGENPYYDFASMEIENFPKLQFMLNFMERKQEFLVNSMYFLNNQERFYKNNEMPYNSISELIFKDLLDIYHSYNTMPIYITDNSSEFKLPKW